ncbi:Trm112 family protein [Metallosphaera javensis (ex Sakai et al. 2022)]|uniref:Trm112 family protein n=1 Tax=Metallosphaera javensis (ex Sakai et al. 2022) TaxID=2775498 RepID=UPI00258ED2FA|nr:MAG: hypothetical protein MjAS7_0810 [Metallosphaera javensis (ex Sakai et al. 2022)]
MKYRLMDILACPMCKHFHLDLYVFQEKDYPKREPNGQPPLCEIYCAYKNADVKSLESPPCGECIKKEVVEGLLVCPSCNRWYPIIDEIPRMLPDKLRKRESDLEFLEKYRSKIPQKVLESGLPFNLKS